MLARQHRPSPSVITFFPISEFSYKRITFLLHSSIVKSDNEIGKNNDKKNMIKKFDNEIGKF